MTSAFKDEIRNHLEETIASLRAIETEAATMEACADHNDFATLLTQQHMDMALRERKHSQLNALEAALRKMDNEEWGYCEECGEQIAPARLMANPAAELCIQCQAESEAALRRCA